MKTTGMTLAVAGLIAISSAADAQSSGEFFLNGHVGRTLGMEVSVKSLNGTPVGQKVETESGNGFGLLAGYILPGRPIAVYGSFAQANQDVKNSTEDINFRHLGVGARYDLSPMSPKVTPYLAAEFGQRSGAGESCGGGGCTDYSFKGWYYGGGVGARYTFRPDFSFDGSLNVSRGSFTDYEEGGVSADAKTDSPMNFRIHVGVTWFPKRKAS